MIKTRASKILKAALKRVEPNNLNARIIRNTYIVLIPVDLTNDMSYAGDVAINEARERARKFCLPATWSAKRIGKTPYDYVFRVTRLHY